MATIPLKQFVLATFVLAVSAGMSLDADGLETNSASVGSCVVTASSPLGIIDKMPDPGRAKKQSPAVGLIVLSFDSTQGYALTLSVSGEVLDAKGRRYRVTWLDRETSKPWEGKVDKNKIMPLTFLARLANHDLKIGDSIKMLLVVKDDTGNAVQLSSNFTRLIGAM